jgi:hypothetical protein
MSGAMSKITKSKSKQNNEVLTQSVYNELNFSILPHCQKAKYCKIQQYFSYQTVIRSVTGISLGNLVQTKEIQSVSYAVIHSILHGKERLKNS